MSWEDIIATQNAPRPRRRRDDPEAREQMALVAALRFAGIRFSAQHNGLHLTKAQAGKAKAMGTEGGCPDLLIFDAPPPPRLGAEGLRLVDGRLPVWGVGCAIELKAPDLAPKTDRAGRFSGARPEQREWLEALEARGWAVMVAYGCEDALTKLRDMGYGV